MVMGRPNKGVRHVERVDASRREKDRLKLILQTLTGELSVKDACAKLGLSPARFAEIRLQALQGAVDALAPGRPGRPRKHDPEAELLAKQQAKEEERLRRELRSERIRTEVALMMPELLKEQKRGSRAKSKRSRKS